MPEPAAHRHERCLRGPSALYMATPEASLSAGRRTQLGPSVMLFRLEESAA